MYLPATCAHYNNNWYGHVISTVNEKKRTLKAANTATVLPKDVEKIIKIYEMGYSIDVKMTCSKAALYNKENFRTTLAAL